MGLAVTSGWIFWPERQNGEVVRVLDDWKLPDPDLWAVCPTGRLASAKARVFLLASLRLLSANVTSACGGSCRSLILDETRTVSTFNLGSLSIEIIASTIGSKRSKASPQDIHADTENHPPEDPGEGILASSQATGSSRAGNATDDTAGNEISGRHPVY